MPKYKFPLKAHEITTIIALNGVGKKRLIKKYIVLARTTSRAIDITPFEDEEEILQAKEMIGYQVVVEGRK